MSVDLPTRVRTHARPSAQCSRRSRYSRAHACVRACIRTFDIRVRKYDRTRYLNRSSSVCTTTSPKLEPVSIRAVVSSMVSICLRQTPRISPLAQPSSAAIVTSDVTLAASCSYLCAYPLHNPIHQFGRIGEYLRAHTLRYPCVCELLEVALALDGVIFALAGGMGACDAGENVVD